jgi:putative ABC transport system permease protein
MRVSPFSELLNVPLARPRFNAFLIDVFGVAALLLAAIGLYAVIAAYVRQRYRELGVRVALGAQRSSVLRLVLRQGMTLLLVGVVLGIVGAGIVSQYLRTLLFGVTPLDVGTFAAVCAIFGLVAGVACVLPALRAAAVDPGAILRCE